LNHAERKLLESLPGVGVRRAARLMALRPFNDASRLEEALEDPKLAYQLAALARLGA
jgi:DNA uptake protein ComE-like DNA-binding protein